MLIFLAGGAISLMTMHKEEFPNIEPGIVEIMVPYLGAAPEEVEEAVCVRVEEAVEGWMVSIELLPALARNVLCPGVVTVRYRGDNAA